MTTPDDAGYEDLPVPGAPQALIVAPTRELAVQVAEDLKVAGSKRGIRIATIYGGRAYEPQIEELERGVEIVVGTPGRLIDLHRQRYLKLKNVNIVVLDEADEMLDLASCPMWRRSSRRCRRSAARPCCSRPPCRVPWSPWLAAT